MRWCVLGLTVVSLAGCAYVHQRGAGFLQKRDKAYLKSHSEPALRVPGNLSRSKIRDDFSIPPAMSHASAGISVLPPYSLRTGQLPFEQVLLQPGPDGYPGVVVRHGSRAAYRILIVAIRRGNRYQIMKQQPGIPSLRLRAKHTGREYGITFIPFAASTRLYFTKTDGMKLARKQAEALAMGIFDSLHQQKVWQNNARFLKPLL